ncbi:hypothetical protein D3C87_1502940 [compost metagenome]
MLYRPKSFAQIATPVVNQQVFADQVPEGDGKKRPQSRQRQFRKCRSQIGADEIGNEREHADGKTALAEYACNARRKDDT